MPVMGFLPLKGFSFTLGYVNFSHLEGHFGLYLSHSL